MSLLKPRENVGIFVSYRRADTAGHAGRLVDHLKTQFGQQVFFDVDSISPGANFHKVIEETFAKCGAVVVLIGKSWLERDASMPPFGDSKDVITQEIRFAMESNLPIVPVLVDGATMPSESTLPSQLATLSKLNAIDLRHTSFDRDLQAVREQLGEILGARKSDENRKGFPEILRPFFRQLLCAYLRRNSRLFSRRRAVGIGGAGSSGHRYQPARITRSFYSISHQIRKCYDSKPSGRRHSGLSFSVSSAAGRSAGGVMRPSLCASP